MPYKAEREPEADNLQAAGTGRFVDTEPAAGIERAADMEPVQADTEQLADIEPVVDTMPGQAGADMERVQAGREPVQAEVDTEPENPAEQAV